jgi:hypothetical protein
MVSPFPVLRNLFDRLVDASEQRGRDFEAERFGGLEIDGEAVTIHHCALEDNNRGSELIYAKIIAQRLICRQDGRQNIRLSLTNTQRPFWTCCTWVMVLARWLVFENLVGGELKMS